ncbi:MAG: proline--tRNA ligase [Holosporales bacterium]|jgi:prolyl-tRNA synthetase|nr:proline--tRNA ligase [Holosporales bacterium]
MAIKRNNALSVTRREDFSKWYQEVITEAELAENSSIRGCMVIKPYGFAIWENMQNILDNKFKELGHHNCYFPLFIPINLFEKEAEHIAGFAKEMAIVTHHRLEQKDGKLVPAASLEVPLAIRPTSELIIGESMANWMKSYRDLPILINQWCNVVRWEMRTRMFLRTTEFLWQEGHTAHETKKEAEYETKTMHEVYRWFIQDILKMHAIPGKKPEHEKFPGAIDTFTIESMMQDGKSLQAATSHYLGQNFAKAVNMQFQARDGSLQFAHTTSWGISTRIVGGLIMSHSDDDGLNLPSSIAPYHIVIIPLFKGEKTQQEILEYCKKIKTSLPKNIRAFIDIKDVPPQDKKWAYIKKGVPFVCEIGSKEVIENTIFFTKRLSNLERFNLKLEEFITSIDELLEQHNKILEERVLQTYKEKSITASSFEELKEFFVEHDFGFVTANWAGSKNNLELLDNLSVTIRCIPLLQNNSPGNCILTGEKTTMEAIFAKSY